MAKIISSIGNSSITKTSQLINDGENSTSEYVEFIELGDVAISNDYNDLDNIPTTFIPSPHTHIVTDISGNKSQFNNSLIDGDFLFVGDVSETPDATTSTKGKLKLAGDLGGTADLPTVPGLATKEPQITAGTTSQYYRGDKSWQTLDKNAVGLSSVDNTSDVDKPVSTAQATADTDTLNSAKSYADGIVTGAFIDQGGYDASANLFPSSVNTIGAVAIKKGFAWEISVLGTLGGQDVQVGDIVRALVNAPGQTAGNWNISERNLTYVPENLSNKSTDIDADKTSTTKYGSVKAIYDWAVGKFQSLLVSGTNIKTVGGNSILGSGNVTEVQNSLTASAVLAPSVTAVNTGLSTKQNTLTAGTNITIVGDTISASGGGSIPDATTLVKGIVKLAGDLGGTADLPTTPTALHKSGNETFTGIKSTTNTGTSLLNGISLTNNGTGTSSSFSINNTSSAVGSFITNASSGTGSFVSNTSTGWGFAVTNSSSGTGCRIDNQGSGTGFKANGATAATGFNYVGQNNGSDTFTVSKAGDITGNSFVKSGATASSALLAGGSVLADPISGTGSTNYVGKWSSGTTQVVSSLSDDGDNIGIGTTSVYTGSSIRYVTVNGILGGGISLKINDATFAGRIVSSGAGTYFIDDRALPLFFYTNGNERGSFSSAGAFKVNNLSTNGAVYSNSGILTNVNPSDRRMKNSIKDINIGLEEIMKLRPVSYRWNDNPKSKFNSYGFIAQEVQKVCPELIRPFTDSEGEDRLGLEIVGINTALVKAVQEQQLIINALILRVEALENKYII